MTCDRLEMSTQKIMCSGCYMFLKHLISSVGPCGTAEPLRGGAGLTWPLTDALHLSSNKPPPNPNALASPNYSAPLLNSSKFSTTLVHLLHRPSLPQCAMVVPAAHEFHWQSLARLPNGRVYHTLFDVGGQMYMLGGCDAEGRPCSALDLYSPEVTRCIPYI